MRGFELCNWLFFKVGRLEELLQQQIQETSRLGEILKKEREAYEEVIKQTNYPPSSNFGGELKLISELRRSLEEGIVQNNKLRARLQERLARSSGPDESDGSRSADEVRRLHAKLEESERWNMSLQSRLDALQPRARGVGGSSTNLSVSGSASSSPQLGSSETNGDSQVKLVVFKIGYSAFCASVLLVTEEGTHICKHCPCFAYSKLFLNRNTSSRAKLGSKLEWKH